MKNTAILKKRIQASIKELLGSAPALKRIEILNYDADEAICVAHIDGLIYELKWELEWDYTTNENKVTKSTILAKRID
jgi:hypothetical protein